MKPIPTILSERSHCVENLARLRRELAAAHELLEQLDRELTLATEVERAGLACQARSATLPSLPLNYTEWDHEGCYAVPFFLGRALAANDNKHVRVLATDEGFALVFSEPLFAPEQVDLLTLNYTFTQLEELCEKAKKMEYAASQPRAARATSGSEPAKRKPTLDLSHLEL